MTALMEKMVFFMSVRLLANVYGSIGWDICVLGGLVF